MPAEHLAVFGAIGGPSISLPTRGTVLLPLSVSTTSPTTFGPFLMPSGDVIPVSIVLRRRWLSRLFSASFTVTQIEPRGGRPFPSVTFTIRSIWSTIFSAVFDR